MDFCKIGCIDEPLEIDVAVTLRVGSHQRLLKSDLLTWEGGCADLLDDLLGTVHTHGLEVLDLLAEVALDRAYLNDTCEEGIKFIEHYLDVLL